VYKGLEVTVYTVDKLEISLTRQDLVELVNVCNQLFLKLFIANPPRARYAIIGDVHRCPPLVISRKLNMTDP